MSLYMESTEIPAEKTANEIKSVLIASGATAIYEKYENKEIVGLSFQLQLGPQLVPFSLPVRIEPVEKLLLSRYSRDWVNNRHYGDERKEKIRLQAKRVAWRQLLRWVQAQLAMIDTGMVQSAEVFMPYIEVAPGRTAFQVAMESGRLLTAGTA